MKHHAIVAAACLWAVAAPVSAGSLAPAEICDDHVNAAIDLLVEELYRRKHDTRFWEPADGRNGQVTTQGGGLSALVVLAMLHAGQSYQEPRLADAIEFLADFEMKGTYAVATRAHVWAKLPAKFRDNLDADARWLMDAYSDRAAGWDYTARPTTTRLDNSIRQYGVLGLWEASKRGVRIPPAFWQRMEDAFIDCQLDDGGWNYRDDDTPPRGSMTAAGLTVLYITQDLLHSSKYLDAGGKRPERLEASLGRGLGWMERHFSAAENPGRGRDLFYYLYGVERVGLASGRTHFAKHDWFRGGVATILDELCTWDEHAGTLAIASSVAGAPLANDLVARRLAFALLFLSRGRSSVAFNKLEVPGLAWNNRPRDVANLTEWLSTVIEPAVGWQVVSMDAAPEAWLTAPVLYLASHQALPWVNEQGAVTDEMNRVKRYLDLGGLLLAVNEGRGRQLALSVETMGTMLYPQYAWRTLPKDHWVYTVHQPLRGRPPMRGLSNGVRELIIVSPGDVARSFQARDEKREHEFQAAANVYFYASELTRRRPRLVAEAKPAAANATTTIGVVRAVHGGNWNAEPLALERAAGDLAARRGLTLAVTEHPLASIHELAPPPALVTVSGTGGHELAAEEVAALAAYVDRGGVVLVETPGGAGDCTAAAERSLAAALGLPVEGINQSRIVTGRDLDGAIPLGRVGWRAFALDRFEVRETGPRLRGLSKGGQVRIVFSREDLSHGWLDRPCWGIVGYSPRSARDLLGNIALHAADLRRNDATP